MNQEENINVVVAGCTACKDSVYNRITDLVESGKARSVSQAVEWTCDEINKAIGEDIYTIGQVRGIYRRGVEERIGRNGQPNNGTSSTSNTKSDQITESATEKSPEIQEKNNGNIGTSEIEESGIESSADGNPDTPDPFASKSAGGQNEWEEEKEGQIDPPAEPKEKTVFEKMEESAAKKEGRKVEPENTEEDPAKITSPGERTAKELGTMIRRMKKMTEEELEEIPDADILMNDMVVVVKRLAWVCGEKDLLGAITKWNAER